MPTEPLTCGPQTDSHSPGNSSTSDASDLENSTEYPPAAPLLASKSKIEIQKSKIPPRRPGPKSKIAKLPKPQRDLVNQLLDDEKTYEQVVEELAKQGVSLNPENVRGWFNADYQDYLSALEWQEQFQLV